MIYDKLKHRSLREYLALIESGEIEKALWESSGNITEAAEALALQRTTLVEKLKKFQIKAADYKRK